MTVRNYTTTNEKIPGSISKEEARGQKACTQNATLAHTKTETTVPPTSACRQCRKSSSAPSSTPGTTKGQTKKKDERKKKTNKQYNHRKNKQTKRKYLVTRNKQPANIHMNIVCRIYNKQPSNQRHKQNKYIPSTGGGEKTCTVLWF